MSGSARAVHGFVHQWHHVMAMEAMLGAWAPVTAALRDVYGPIDDAVANHALANVVYQLRWATAAVAQFPEAPAAAVRESLCVIIDTYKKILER